MVFQDIVEFEHWLKSLPEKWRIYYIFNIETGYVGYWCIYLNGVEIHRIEEGKDDLSSVGKIYLYIINYTRVKKLKRLNLK